MATVILDVPSEKIQPFVQMVLQLGIEKHRISSSAFEVTSSREESEPNRHWFKSNSVNPSSLYWELNKNELEFE